jgi:hypothetical protein
MDDHGASQIVEQITLRKLVYAREFLKKHGHPYSGSREKVRERLAGVLDRKPELTPELHSLLDELDVWGTQRLRLAVLPQSVLEGLGSEAKVRQRVEDAGMSDLLDGRIALVPPEATTPMAISYKETSEGRFLTLIAAKTRNVFIPMLGIPDVTFEEHPGVVFKPYKEETQKAVDFAEINLESGFTVSSTTLVKSGFSFRAEFGEFYEVFSSLMPLDDAQPVVLYNATHNIRERLPQTEVRIRARKARTSVGGVIGMSSHTSKVDMRADPELLRTEDGLLNAPCAHCNCYWEPVNGLEEIVHTHIFAPEGEISIMAQVKENSARYVLRRILALN